MIRLPRKKSASSVLGLSLAGSRLEGVVVRRHSAGLIVESSFSAALSLDPLTNAAELVGQEIRNQLDKAGIRERRCILALPLGWLLTLHSRLPALEDSDVASFLQIEAERGFPCAPEALLTSVSRLRTSDGEQWATQVAVPKDHALRLDQALRAARLKPLAFKPGLEALQPPERPSSEGVLTVALSEHHAGLLVTCGGGVAALRQIEITAGSDGAASPLDPEIVLREIRITLGQLPEAMRSAITQIKVFGQGTAARDLAAQLRPRLAPLGISIQEVSHYAPGDFATPLPPATAVSTALSLAAQHLSGKRGGLDFLPPRARPWREFSARYTSKRLAWFGAAAAAAALIAAAPFLFQQWQLSQLRSAWATLAPQTAELDNLQQQIRRFRPWFDESRGSLSILRRLTEAFPEDGAVTAKTLEIREAANVNCSGVARDNAALLKTLDRLRATREVGEVKVDQIRGKAPLQFSFNFHWGERSANEH